MATHYQIFSHSLKQNIKTGILNRILITFYHLQLIFGDFLKFSSPCVRIMSSLQLQENDLLSCRKYSCVKSQFWPVSGPVSSISVLLILGLELVDLELQVVHLSEPPYPRSVEARGSLRWKKLCWGGSSSAPAPSPLTGGIPSPPHPHKPKPGPLPSAPLTCVSLRCP